MYSILNCYNVTKHAEFCLGKLRFYATATGSAGCFKRRFTALQAYINLFRGHVQRFELL
jgi:hypothetical protein